MAVFDKALAIVHDAFYPSRVAPHRRIETGVTMYLISLADSAILSAYSGRSKLYNSHIGEGLEAPTPVGACGRLLISFYDAVHLWVCGIFFVVFFPILVLITP